MCLPSILSLFFWFFCFSFVLINLNTNPTRKQIEIFKALHRGMPMRVYFLVYSESFQEQKYLSSIRYEKQAFEYLVSAKGHMAIQVDQV